MLSSFDNDTFCTSTILFDSSPLKINKSITMFYSSPSTKWYLLCILDEIKSMLSDLPAEFEIGPINLSEDWLYCL